MSGNVSATIHFHMDENIKELSVKALNTGNFSWVELKMENSRVNLHLPSIELAEKLAGAMNGVLKDAS